MYSVVTTTTGRLLNEYGFKNNINVVVRVVQYDRKFYYTHMIIDLNTYGVWNFVFGCFDIFRIQLDQKNKNTFRNGIGPIGV